MCDIGLLMPVGEKRGRYYEAADPLKKIREQCAEKTRAPNPYDLVREVTRRAAFLGGLTERRFFDFGLGVGLLDVVAKSTMRLAHWLRSRGRLGCCLPSS